MNQKKKRIRKAARRWWPTRGKKTAFGIAEWTLMWICVIFVLIGIWGLLYYSRHPGG